MVLFVFTTTTTPVTGNFSETFLRNCLPSKDWLIDILIVLVLILFFLLVGAKHELVRALLGPELSRIVQGCRTVLFRSQEFVAQSDSQGDSTVSKNSGCLHTA